MGSVRDAQEALLASEQRFHHLVDAVTDYAIFLLDTTGHVATWNEGARRIKGYDTDEIVGTHFATFYTPEDRAADKPMQVLEACCPAEWWRSAGSARARGSFDRRRGPAPTL